MAAEGLVDKASRGAGAMALRQGVSAGLGLLGLVMVARSIGPDSYGVYVAALAFVLTVSSLAQWGVGLALVRSPEEPTAEDLGAATALLALAGLAALAVGGTAAWLVFSDPEMTASRWASLAMLGGLAACLPGTVPLALLERRLDFRRIAMVEMAGSALWLAAGWTLASCGAGLWALPLAWILQQMTQNSCWFLLARHRPRPVWAFRRLHAFLAYGSAYATAVVTWQVRPLLPPAVIGPGLGSAAVGQAGLAARLVDALSLVRYAVWRACTPALGRLRDDTKGLTLVVRSGGAATLAATGLLCGGFTAARPLVDAIIGSSWSSALELFPFFAVHGLCAALVALVSLVLHIHGLSLRVAAFHLAHILVLGLVGLFAVPRLGLAGWAWAELAACLTFAIPPLLCPAEIRRRLLPGLGLLALLIPGIAWFLFQPCLPSGALHLASVAITLHLAWRWWRQAREHTG